MGRKKAEVLETWSRMPENQSIITHMNTIPYKTSVSKFGACGIRIDGTPQYIDAVLSHMKELLVGENQITRLERSRNDAVSEFKASPNAEKGGEVCYIRLHMRGREGQVAAGFDRSLNETTDRFLASHKT